MLKRGDKVSVIGEDSVFEGFFIAAFEKLPMDYKGEAERSSGKWRSIVQQKDGTGIVLIKCSPEKLQKGWRSEAPYRTYDPTTKTATIERAAEEFKSARKPAPQNPPPRTEK